MNQQDLNLLPIAEEYFKTIFSDIPGTFSSYSRDESYSPRCLNHRNHLRHLFSIKALQKRYLPNPEDLRQGRQDAPPQSSILCATNPGEPGPNNKRTQGTTFPVVPSVLHQRNQCQDDLDPRHKRPQRPDQSPPGSIPRLLRNRPKHIYPEHPLNNKPDKAQRTMGRNPNIINWEDV